MHIMQHFQTNFFTSDVSQPKKRFRLDTSFSDEDGGQTIDVPCIIAFTNDQIQVLTEYWSNKPYPTNCEMKRISQELKLPVDFIEVNNMPKSI